MAGERDNWYKFFNPCGGGDIAGYVFRSCHDACSQGGINCLAGKAYQMAGFVLKDGSSVSEQETNDFLLYLNSMLGKTMVRLDGTTVTLTQDNFDELLKETARRARTILRAIRISPEQTRPITDEYLEQASPEQRDILQNLAALSIRARSEFVHAPQSQIERFVEQMRGSLSRAIELNLDELRPVTMLAINYGLGERVLAKRGIPIAGIPTRMGTLERYPPFSQF